MDSGKLAAAMTVAVAEEEKEGLIEVLDFDMLCSRVALKTNQGKLNTKLHEENNYYDQENYDDDEEMEILELGGAGGGVVFRMWEGDLVECFDDQRLLLQSSFCPWYRFGENMKLAGFGSSFLQGFVYIILATIALCNFVAFAVTKKHCFLYIGVAFVLSLGAYLGFHRTKMRNKFNIKTTIMATIVPTPFVVGRWVRSMDQLQMGNNSSLDDCVSHLICPCCTLAQETRTLEMNNVHDGTWHGRGDTMCIGKYVEGVKAFELVPPSIASINSP